MLYVTQTSVKQTMLLDGINVGPPKWGIYGRGLNRSVHEGMKDISNVKVHLKTHSGNVKCTVKADDLIRWYGCPYRLIVVIVWCTMLVCWYCHNAASTICSLTKYFLVPGNRSIFGFLEQIFNWKNIA